jgi:hypothetical protein
VASLRRSQRAFEARNESHVMAASDCGPVTLGVKAGCDGDEGQPSDSGRSTIRTLADGANCARVLNDQSRADQELFARAYLCWPHGQA